METECDTLYAKEFDTSQREDHLSFIKTQNKFLKLEEELVKVTERVEILELKLNDPIPKNLKGRVHHTIKHLHVFIFYVV